MKKLLLSLLLVAFASAPVLAQGKVLNYKNKEGGTYAAITIESADGSYDPAKPITIYYDANKGFTPQDKKNLASESYIYMHSGAGTTNTTFWEVFPPGQEWGKDHGIGKMEMVAAGVFAITITPAQFYTDKGGSTYSGPLPSIGCVFRNADGSGEGKFDGGVDFMIIFPEGDPEPVKVPYKNKTGVEYEALSFFNESGIYDATKPIAMVYNANLGYTPDGKKNLASEPYIYCHGGAGTTATTFWEVMPAGQEWGKDNGVGKMEQLAAGVFGMMITPNQYFTMKGTDQYTGPLPSIGCVFRSADGSGEGKASAAEGDFFVVFDGVNSVQDGEGIKYGNLSAYPNPSQEVTTIKYDVLEKATSMRVAIYDLQGNLVKELVNAIQEPGHYNVFWSGTNAAGESVASGAYLYRISSGSYTTSKSIILNK